MGMHCGTRACGLVVLAALASAFAPALARADVTGGQLPSVAPAVSTPVLPAVPPPVAPATGTGNAATTAPQTIGGTAAFDPAHASVTINVPVAHVGFSPTAGSIGVDVSKPVAPVHHAVVKAATRAYTKATSVKPVHKALRKADKTSKKAGRILAGGMGGPDDPLSGCESGGWTSCTVLPLSSTPIDNRCWMYQNGMTSGVSDGTDNLPPQNFDYVYFTQGTAVLWTKVDNVLLGGLPAVRFRMKEFVWGFVGAGTLDASTYRLGHDFQDEWVVTVPVGGTAVKKLTQDVLKVNSGLAPDEQYTEHFIVDPSGQITIRWHIVCHQGETGDNVQSDDHDRSGNMDKYKHNHGDYQGYNDNEPTSWDQND